MTDIVGIDPGTSRIGVAVADSEVRMALPLGTVDARRGFTQAAQAIADLLVDRDISEVIIGLPLHLSGQESKSSQQARMLGNLLEQALECSVRYWDERLTTLQAEHALREADVDSRRQKDVIDQTAAAIILQNYLDSASDSHG